MRGYVLVLVCSSIPRALSRVACINACVIRTGEEQSIVYLS